MMNNNKILTVSYGTFSCTLEGFEDSFGTMKVIAEYFRDLAADDRYFGAEPPQPDAELMARIAEKEMTRRVEARQQDGKIVLSAMDAAAAPAALAAATAYAAPTAEPVEEDTAEQVTLEADAEEIDDSAVVAVEEMVEDAAVVDAVTTDDIAGEIEDSAPEIALEAVEDPEAADAEAAADAAEAAGPEITVPETEVTPEADMAEAQPVEAQSVEIVPGKPDEEVSAFFADAEPAPADDADEAEEMAAPAAADNSAAPESIAAKLQRIRDVVAKNETAAASSDYLEDEHAEGSLAAATDEDTVAEDAGMAEVEDLPVSDAAEDAVADGSDPTDAPEDETAEAVEAILADDAADTMAADTPMAEDLEDAVTDATRADTDDTAAEAQGAPDLAAETEDAEDAPALLADAVADIEDALDADNAQDILADISAEHGDDTDGALDAALDAIDHQYADDSADEVSLEEALEEAVQQDAAETVENLFDSDAEEPAEETYRPTSRVKTTILEPLGPEEIAATERVSKSRIVKVKRADLEAAIEKNARDQEARSQAAAPSAEDIADEDTISAALEAAADVETAADRQDTAAAAQASSLSAQEEDDLTRELAAVAEEFGTQDPEDAQAEDAFPTLDKDAEQEAQQDRKISSRGLLPSLEDGSGSAVSRLLAETDQQMGEPEGATRRDAFAQLRAAVAAKKADSSIEREGLESDSPYREDLAEVVRPRRTSGEPTSDTPEAERADELRPAPLKLVAEQRIDTTEDAADDVREDAEEVAVAPVAPRRVSSAAVEAQPASASTDEFVKFAQEMGASSLPQLLEAAAAYMTFVEGREQFSRPQLMTKVRQAEGPDGFSREDGLRSFGQLLRAGKIEKLKGGRFTVSDDIGFRPDHRAAG